MDDGKKKYVIDTNEGVFDFIEVESQASATHWMPITDERYTEEDRKVFGLTLYKAYKLKYDKEDDHLDFVDDNGNDNFLHMFHKGKWLKIIKETR